MFLKILSLKSQELSSSKAWINEVLHFFRFKDQIHDVFKMLSADVQVILLSATMPDDVLEVSRCFMRDPVRILVQKEEVSYYFDSYSSIKLNIKSLPKLCGWELN